MSCDVTGCSEQTFMGWRPLTERIGRKVCEYHWRRHKDENDSFDLFEAFGFERPVGMTKPTLAKQTSSCKVLDFRRLCPDCGQPRESGHRYCSKCSKRRKAESNRKRQQRHYKRQKPNAFVGPLLRPYLAGSSIHTALTGHLGVSERILWRNCNTV